MLARSADDSACDLRFGPHVFRWELPDLGHVIYDGQVEGPRVASLNEETWPWELASYQPLRPREEIAFIAFFVCVLYSR